VPASPAKRQAQYDLTQKLRAMDLALERIERDGGGGHMKENVDPMVGAGSRLAASPCRSVSSPAPAPQPGPAVATPHTSPALSRQHEELAWRRSEAAEAPHAAVAAVCCPRPPSREASPAPAGHIQTMGLASMEASWREAHAALRAELVREIGGLRDGLREGEEDRQRSNVRLLTDFEVELTSALEARAKEADELLEKRLIEATEGLQRRLADVEASVCEDRERLAGVEEGELERRLAEMESTVKEIDTTATADRTRVAETGQSCGEALQVAKEQLATFRQRIQQLQDDNTESKEQMTSLCQRVKQLQSDRDETKEHMGSLKLRLHQSQTETGGATDDVDRRLQRLDESLGARLIEVESSVTSQLSTQQRAMDAQVQELQRRLEDVQHRVLSDVGELRAHRELVAQREDRVAVMPEARFEELRHLCDLELAALRGRIEASELGCAEDTQALRISLEAVEARGSAAAEANLTTRLRALRADVDEGFEQERRTWAERLDQLNATCAQEARDTALAEVDRQLNGADEDRRRFGSLVEALSDRQQRQQSLIEDLLASAARRAPDRSSVCDPGYASGLSGGSNEWRAPGAAADRFVERAEWLSSRVDALGARVSSLEDRAASAAQDRVAAAATAAEVFAGPSSHLAAAEATEALRMWPRKIECLSTRLDGSKVELRAELRSVEDIVTKQVAELKDEAAKQAALLQDISSRVQQGGHHGQAGKAEYEDLHRRAEAEAERTTAALKASEAALAASDIAGNKSDTASAKADSAIIATDALGFKVDAAVAAAEVTSMKVASIEDIVAEAGNEAKSLRQLADTHGQAVAQLTATGSAAPRASSEEDSRGSVVRLEARVELAEARHRVALQEMQKRVDELNRRAAFALSADGASEAAPWVPALRELERELKALLVSQIEDSAAALRHVAAIVAEKEKERCLQSPYATLDTSGLSMQHGMHRSCLAAGVPHAHNASCSLADEQSMVIHRRGMGTAPSTPMRSTMGGPVPSWR